MPALKLTETGQATNLHYKHQKHFETAKVKSKVNIRISPDAAQCHLHDHQFQAFVWQNAWQSTAKKGTVIYLIIENKKDYL